jgi:hypothetical protein
LKFLLLLFLFSFMTQARDNCQQADSQGNVDKLLKDCTKILSQDVKDDSLEAALSASVLFLDKYKESVKFDQKEAEFLLKRILSFVDKASPKNKSQIYLMASGIHGRISDKLRSNGGPEHGKLALSYLKQSLHHNRMNQSAAKAFATTISRFSEKNFVMRKFIEAGLGIKIDAEVKLAMKYLEDAGLKSDPLYQNLKKF